MSKVQINNVELYYKEHGTGVKHIVFIHGFLSSSNMWKNFYLSHLHEKYHAYAVDVRGHGRSHHIKQGCNLIQLADDVYQFARHLQIERCTYIGMSMGGAIGVQLALDHPEILNGLILMNPGLGSVFSEGYKYKLVTPFLSLMAKNRWLLKIFLKSTLTRPLPEEILHDFLNDAMLVSRETWMEYLHPSNRILSLDRIRRFEVPTLVMIGNKDHSLPLDLQHQLADIIPNAHKIVFDDEGHGMVIENPEAVFKAMSSFIEQLP